MRDGIIGIIIGIVVGVVIGATIIAPRLEQRLEQELESAFEQGPASPPTTNPPTTQTQAVRKARKPAEVTFQAPVSPTMTSTFVRWNMASAFGGALPQLGTLAKRIETKIWRVSGGTFEIKFHEPGTLAALTSADDMFDAVASGAIDAAFASSGAWQGKSPALQLFSSIPFGPPAEELLAWVYFGGGEELANAIYRRHNTRAVFCGMIAPEAGGWFRKPISTVDDLKGLNMRISGLGARVVEKLGVRPRPLNEGDIFMALEQGAIDAAEFSMPAIDLKLNFHELARYYYFPGWHQPATLFTLLVNLDRWNALTVAQRAQVEAVCGDNVRYGLAEGESLQYGALKTMTELGVRILTWPVPVLEAFERAWRDVATEQAAADEDFARVWDSLKAFRQDYAIWNELGRL